MPVNESFPATEGSTEDATHAEDELETQIERYLHRNFPQIRSHGGDAVIESIDVEAGAVWIRLTGACSGCGISPVTVQALQSRMVAQFDELSVVHADTGMSASDHGLGGDFEDVPF